MICFEIEINGRVGYSRLDEVVWTGSTKCLGLPASTHHLEDLFDQDFKVMRLLIETAGLEYIESYDFIFGIALYSILVGFSQLPSILIYLHEQEFFHFNFKDVFTSYISEKSGAKLLTKSNLASFLRAVFAYGGDVMTVIKICLSGM